MDVSILDVKSLKRVYRYKLKVDTGEHGPSEKDLFILAWRCVLSDGAVNENEQDQYLLSLETQV